MTNTQLLVRKILERATVYTWSTQGLGMLRLYLSPELRLHIWDSDYRVPNVSSIHDHPWSFTSEVVVGQIINKRYMFMDTPRAQTYKMVSIKCGPGGCALSPPELVALQGPFTEVFNPGESYSQQSDDIHDTEAPDGTVTLVRRQFDKADRDTARVFWRGGDWVSAEPREATCDEVRDITQRSLKRWF